VALARLACGLAASWTSPHKAERDRLVADLRADASLADDLVPRILASPAAAGWANDMDPAAQTWINAKGEERPTPELIGDGLGAFPALATKPWPAIYTSTALPGLPSIWLTGDPYDWSMPPPGRTLWRPRFQAPPRCYEIHSRADWAALCERFPTDATDAYRQSLDNSSLGWAPPFIAPDWPAVRVDYDAVHLSWAGFVDANDETVEVAGGTSIVCGWGAESTVWLRWVFSGWDRLPG
jgi:hypothetical protein